MKKVILFFLTVFAISVFADTLNWQTDFDQALAMSQKEKKPVFAFFTGSDWCGWCIKLDKEILSKKEMIQYLNKKFILFKADFPRKNQPPRNVMAKNQALMQKYGVEGFPTIIITDSKGVELGKTGYMRGGPAAMKKVLDQYIRKAPEKTVK